jgi:hypothetical protein
LQHIRPIYSKNYLREFLRVLNPEGILVFQLPSQLVNQTTSSRISQRPFDPDNPIMEMHGVKKEEVLNLLRHEGGSVIHLETDTSLGSEWESFRYYVRKQKFLTPISSAIKPS